MESTKNLSERLYNYLATDDNFNLCCESLKIKSVVDEVDITGKRNPNSKRYMFIGAGCGITYLKYNRNSKKGEVLDKIEHKVIRRVIDNFISRFSKKEQEYYKNIGCSLSAIFSQDQRIQMIIYSSIVEFAKNELGIKKIDFVSVLD